MDYFRAEAGKTYKSNLVGTTASFTAEQLAKDPNAGMLPTDYVLQASGAAQSPSAQQDVSGVRSMALPEYNSLSSTAKSNFGAPSPAPAAAQKEVNVITSNDANQKVADSAQASNTGLTKLEQDQSRLDMQYAQKAARQQKLMNEEAALKSVLGSVNATELANKNAEEQRTQKAAEFRLGQTGTYYQENAADKAKQAYEGQVYRLNLEDQILQKQISQAYENNNVNLANELQAKKDKLVENAVKQQESAARMKLLAIDTETKQLDLLGKREESGMKKISNLIEGGVDFTNDTAPEFQQIADELDWTPKQLKSYVSLVKKTLDSKKEIDVQARYGKELDNAGKMIDFLDKTGAGSTIKIGNYSYQYQGQKAPNVYEGTETDEFGNVVHWTLDKKTGVKSLSIIGPYGKPQDGWTQVQTDQGWYNYNTKTGAYVPATPSINATTLQAVFKEGTAETPFRPGAESNLQCGALQNDCNDPAIGRIWKDKLSEKIATANGKNPVTGENWSVPISDVLVGDTIIQGGSDTGHVFRVLDRKTMPNGKDMVLAFESNMVPPGGGVVSSTRWVDISDKNNVAAARVPIRPELEAGTDSPLTQAVMGGVPTIGGKPITQVLGEKDTKSKELLTPNEAKELGVAYGTTRGQAAKMGIVPGAKPTVQDIALPSFQEWAKNAEAELAKDASITSTDPQKLKALYDKTVGAAPSYLDGAFNLSIKMSDKKGPAFVSDVRSAIENGDFARAQDKLKKAALDTADNTTSQQVRGRDMSMRAIENIERDLQDYIAKGGDIGIITGTSENIKQKIGGVNDPERRRIATKIQSALADYRRSISGAAFTEQEKAEYERMFPSILNGEALNAANISALKEIFSQNNETFYRQQLGNENYDSIFANR